MAKRLTMNPELSEAVARARATARETGELLEAPTEQPRSPLPPELRAVLADWRASGDFSRDVAEVAAGDPDLATQ